MHMREYAPYLHHSLVLTPRCSSGANAGESAICPELDISFRHMWEWIFLISSISLQLLATDGNFWQLLATDGNFWQLLATYGNLWQLLATFDN